ncbi:tRNA-intron lyase [Halosimplex aquaticum]|uniref:tRNA-splicing endonuclease n=1 Tax=Halosimplex aquaticum TaxID=3026162 RepID=A0ABD5Y5N3_9EURY|nr:tRNA-intron lyase [Halosimplex aquaticum]
MEATLSGDVVRAGDQARERFYDSSGYGHPVDAGALELAPVEAAHLLYRGDLDAVESSDGEAMDFRAFLASAAVSETAFLVYKDLRDRGFYLSPARAGWTDSSAARSAIDDPAVDFVVYPRGSGPWDDEVAYRVAVVSEREGVPSADLGDLVLAVVDEESELTYLETEHREISGTSDADLPEGVSGELLSDRVLLWDPPEALYERAFYGQPLDDQRGDVIQLSLLEAAYLAREGLLEVDGRTDPIVARGRDVEGERFDRRLRVYESLRDRGVVPKTGYKFGADFRTYADVESVEDLGHSELLVRVFPAGHTFSPRDLALDVRLAHGVRKTMVFALVGDDGEAGGGDVEWLSVTRLTP